MKKACVFALASILTVPVFAAAEPGGVGSDVAVDETHNTYLKTSSNPETKFPKGLELGIGVSVTGGLDGFVGYNNKKFDSFWWKRFGVRLGYAGYSPIKNKLNSRINSYIGDDGAKIDDDLRLDNVALNAKHMGALIDFYPFGDTWFLGGLRISGGYMTGKLDVNADIHGDKNKANVEFELNDTRYSYDDNTKRGRAVMNWKYSGPYLGTGFDLGLFYGFKIYMDAGVVFTDNHAKLDLNIPIEGLKNVAANELVQENTTLEDGFHEDRAKTIADAQKELDKIDYYPIVKFGFMYRF